MILLVFGHCWSCRQHRVGGSASVAEPAKPWQELGGACCAVPVPLGLWGCWEGSKDTQNTAGHAAGPAVGVWGQPRLEATALPCVGARSDPDGADGSGQGPPWDQQSHSICPWVRCRQLPSPHSARFDAMKIFAFYTPVIPFLQLLFS